MKKNNLKVVPSGLFNKGKAGKIFDDIVEKDSRVLVIKNNKPRVVIMPYEQYCKLSRLKTNNVTLSFNSNEAEEQ